jgi:hypothetical protein
MAVRRMRTTVFTGSEEGYVAVEEKKAISA